jgi:uncharacterized protein (TIGR03437 family)
LPAASPVRRSGAGFVQELTSSDGAIRYLLAKADARPSTYLVTGALLVRYLALGGPGGILAFPTADATPAGRQLFEGGALAGDPVVLLTGTILGRWSAQNYETGSAGLPVSESRIVLSFAATAGLAQDFRRGSIVAATTGSAVGRAFLVTGLVWTRYQAVGGPGGQLGLPTGEELTASGRRRQDFEGGVIEYTPGDVEAVAAERPRRPLIFANPVAVPAGSRVRIAAGGFAAGSALRISVGGRPDFVVTTETGAYAWEAFVPSSTPSGLVTLRAAEVNGTALAVGSYVVQSASETLVRLTKVRGDLQSGLPGARLPIPLRISVADENGSALPGLPVRFNASPGAQIEEASIVTDERGEAHAWLRLPLSELPALATAEAGRQVVTFSARSQASTLTNFPRFNQTGAGAFGGGGTIAEKGALLSAVAAIVRYGQNRGDLPSPNGAADPAVLNAFLRDYCVFDYRGERICDGFIGAPGSPERNVNLWRLAAFHGGALDVVQVPAHSAAIRDQLAAGSPVLLALTLTTGESIAGSHFVTAIGVSLGGAVLIHDPNPTFARSTLDEYLSGFGAGGRNFRASVEAALVLLPRTPPPLGFLVTSGAPTRVELHSPAGGCGFEIRWYDTAANAAPSGRQPQPVNFRFCDGALTAYQLELSGGSEPRATFTDLANPGAIDHIVGAPGSSSRIYRPESNWVTAPQTAVLAAASPVINAASFSQDLSPGALASVFGSGLARAGETSVHIDGVPASVLAATPFQVNFALPLQVVPGVKKVTVQSPYGTAETTVELQLVSPAIFLLTGGRGAILNESGAVNSSGTPARRGQVIVIYCTGLGPIVAIRGLEVAEMPVTAEIVGRVLEVQFAGAAPGLPGVYQVNLLLPLDIPPGLGQEVRLAVAGTRSNPALVAIE